ncbi:MAG: class II fructose-bisphosphate aldolase, partial [Kiritimatiellae bacterium]|nr:class II fructose-bisphosphate aldolase [Kiritimatiellia bacterium]
MAYVTTEKMLRAAQRGGWAVGAFNAENLEMVQAIVAAAVEARSPVIIQTTTSTLKYASPAAFAGMVRAEAEAANADVALHLDHGADFAICARCLRAGYSSIMIDGSKEPLEDNIAITQRVVEMCRAAGAPVEAELGEVGGKEDATV